MTLTEYSDLEQGSPEWLDVRRGIVTASVVGQLISVGPPSAITVSCPECGAFPDQPCISRARKEPAPIKTLHGTRLVPTDAPPVIQPAANDTSRGLTMTLIAERITGWTDPVYVSDDMFRGTIDEPVARGLYAEHHAPVTEVGFIVREEDDWTLGYSPDGMVGTDGLVEIKSRRAKAQIRTILADHVPAANMAQLQAGLLVTGRSWIDYVSYAGGLPLYVKRVYADPNWQDAIVEAVRGFETTAAETVFTYRVAADGLPMTERVDYSYLNGVI